MVYFSLVQPRKVQSWCCPKEKILIAWAPPKAQLVTVFHLIRSFINHSQITKHDTQKKGRQNAMQCTAHTRSLGALLAPTSSLGAFLRLLRSLGAQAMRPKQKVQVKGQIEAKS